MRVLLVEDDYAVSQSIETMLKKEGMIIDTTDLGEDGLEIGKLYDYDIILLDLMLPDKSYSIFSAWIIFGLVASILTAYTALATNNDTNVINKFFIFAVI